jgi:hypothetical protein
MRAKKLVVFLCLLVASNVCTFFATPYLSYFGDYIYLASFADSENQEQFEVLQTSQEDRWYLAEDRSIYIAVVFPDKDVAGKHDAMQARAEGYLFLKGSSSFCYAGLEKRFGHHTYYFHPLVMVKK